MAEEEKKASFSVAFLAGAAIVVVLVAGVLLISRFTASSGPAVQIPLPFTPVEQAYAEKMRFLEVRVARATNFLNQEITYVYGVMSNDGSRSIREMELTLEFRDLFGQVVLRDTRRVIRPAQAPLTSLEKREFQLTYEHVSDFWNQQPPTIRVTGLRLE